MCHRVPEILPEHKEDRNPHHEPAAFKAAAQSRACSLQASQALLPPTGGEEGASWVMFPCSFNLLLRDGLNPLGLMLELYSLAPYARCGSHSLFFYHTLKKCADPICEETIGGKNLISAKVLVASSIFLLRFVSKSKSVISANAIVISYFKTTLVYKCLLGRHAA